MRPTVSLIIPHFQTPELTLLCLRLLRLKTSGPSYETLVIDNGSTDGSGEILKRIEWIRLFRREIEPGEWPARSHGLALNLGVEHACAPFVVVLHTDTMILRSDWLHFLLAAMEKAGPRCAMVGSWKMESQNLLKSSLKRIEEWWRGARGRRKEPRRYIRSHCALFRKDALAVRPAMFNPTDHCCAGEELHIAAQEQGWTCQFLASYELGRYVRHLNHATMALNGEFGGNDRYMSRTRTRAIRRINAFFRSIKAEEILANDALDRLARDADRAA